TLQRQLFTPPGDLPARLGDFSRPELAAVQQLQKQDAEIRLLGRDANGRFVGESSYRHGSRLDTLRRRKSISRVQRFPPRAWPSLVAAKCKQQFDFAMTEQPDQKLGGALDPRASRGCSASDPQEAFVVMRERAAQFECGVPKLPPDDRRLSAQ